jgi:hypothetical protein
MRALLVALSLLSALPAWAAGTGVLRGHVLNARDHEPVPFANVALMGASRGAVADAEGAFEITGLEPGLYNIQASQLGYRKAVRFEVRVSPVKPAELEIALEEEVLAADSVTVTASPFRTTEASPLSVRSVGEAEIARFPGGDRDISKVLQSLPGVASTVSFRNDLIVRGGAPNENRFVLDEVEIPNINHFATQGSSGGPVSMINVNFIRDVDLLTGAFPANRGNALSSVMELRLKDGNPQALAGSTTVGASDFGVTLDGPLGRRSTFILSARRSYLQLLFDALGLPFLPTYNDAQFKSRTRLGSSDELTLIGVGAIDHVRLNTHATDSEFNRWVLDELPVTPQWNWASGAVWKHLRHDGYVQVVASRDQLDNRSTKYEHNDSGNPANLVQDYRSRETQDHVRVEHTMLRRGLRLDYGGGLDRAEYTTSTFEKRVLPAGVTVVDYTSALRLYKYAAFAQASRGFLGDRLSVSLGVRADASDYSRQTRDAARHLSPRLSLSYALAPKLRLNANAARYHQLPAFTVLGYRDSTGALLNRGGGVTYIRADHVVAGVEWLPAADARLSLEAFSKRYADYPFLTQEGVSLANLGADFGVIGNAPAASVSRGRSYGVELLAQRKLRKGAYGIASYTFVRSEFTDRAGRFTPSSWDNRHVVSATGGRQFGKGWELGARWRLLGGAPYTPDDVALSSLKSAWDVRGRAVPDWSRLNARRTGVLHQLDARLDRKWYFRDRALDVYLDVQNLYGFKPRTAPILVVDRDPVTGAPLTLAGDATRYATHTLKDDNTAIFPTIGITFDF